MNTLTDELMATINRRCRNSLLLLLILFLILSYFLSMVFQPTPMVWLFLGLFGLPWLCVTITLIISTRRFLRWQNQSNHPLSKAVERFGNTREIFASINAHGGDVSRFGDIMLTPSWIIYNKSLDVVALPVEEVLWVYECTNHEFGAPPFSTWIFTRDGQANRFTLWPVKAKEFISALSKRASWIFTGHDAQLENRWKNDRQSLIGEVDSRRGRKQ